MESESLQCRCLNCDTCAYDATVKYLINHNVKLKNGDYCVSTVFVN